MSTLKETILGLARKSIENYIRDEIVLTPNLKDPFLSQKRACFVCLKIDGELRGCIGSLEAVTENLEEEIIKNAIAASVSDPRFPPVTDEELPHLSYSVDILSPLEKTDKSHLDEKKYGVYVKAHGRSGVLLPDLEGVDSVEQQLAIAKAKAGLPANAEVDIFRFTVERFEC